MGGDNLTISIAAVSTIISVLGAVLGIYLALNRSLTTFGVRLESIVEKLGKLETLPGQLGILETKANHDAQALSEHKAAIDMWLKSFDGRLAQLQERGEAVAKNAHDAINQCQKGIHAWELIAGGKVPRHREEGGL
jgi:hypothetical protein